MDKNISLQPVPRRARAQGTGAILAIVAAAVLIVVGMIYIMQPVA